MNHKLSQINQKRPWWQNGQALVEFSLILPVLLLIVFGIIDYGRILLVYSNTSSSIRDAARNATLLSSSAGGTPLYVDCATIQAQARNILFADIQSVNVLYYDTTDRTDAQLIAQTTDITSGIPANADFDCTAGGVPLVTENDVKTGDLMLVTMNVRIEFMTPIFSSMFATLDIDFRAQRTIISGITLDLKGTDRDSDGLLDVWEYQWFGCLLDGWEDDPVLPGDPVVVAMRPDPNPYYVIAEYSKYVALGWSPSGTVNPTAATDQDDDTTWESGTFPDECAKEILDPADYPSGYPEGCVLNDGGTPADSSDDVLEECWVPNTKEFNATDDPDHDGCNNGCEETLGTNPISDEDEYSIDTDGDGLSDGQEANGWTYVYTVNGVPRSELKVTDPLNEDSDGDGLLDGEEVLVYFSDPKDTDTDDDGLSDGDEVDLYGTDPSEADTDNDGLDDDVEIGGYNITIIVNGVTLSFTRSTNAADADSDNDDIDDGDEVSGAPGYVLDPMDADTDDDGLEDGDEISSSIGSAFLSIANESDSDGDLLEDGEEVNTYRVNPGEENTDADSCTAANGSGGHELDDYFEAKSADAEGNENPDGDADYNGADLDSDDDTLPDCEEVYYYGTNAYDDDSDNDNMDDAFELTIYCLDPTIPNSPVIATEAECASGASADVDLDGLPDTWENQYYPDGSDGGTNDYLDYDETNDPDSDNCTNECEYDRRTNPFDPDTDDDLLEDGDELGTDPKDQDSDDDGLWDGHEVYGRTYNLTVNGVSSSPTITTNPTLPDSDADGLLDGEEYSGTHTSGAATNPMNRDTDGDGLTDGLEARGLAFNSVINGVAINTVAYDGVVKSNPLNSNSDTDGLLDYNEVMVHGTYPLNHDTDGDTIIDGSTSSAIGELANDTTPMAYDSYSSNPRLTDTDNDGLSDTVERDGITGYVIYISGVAQAPINLPGYDPDNAASTTRLSMVNPDTDGDGLNDGAEYNFYGTNPLLADTDADGLLDGNEVNAVPPTDPLTPDNNVDTDGDGLTDDDEDNALPPTDPTLFDSDGDGMGDGDEDLSVTIAATGYNLSTDATYAINFNSVPVSLDTTFQDNDGDGVADGYDSDGDGLSDAYEMYWYRSTSFIQAIHPQFTAFSGSSESCGYSLTPNQPLHPDDPDTDNDGLLDGDECNIYNTNPFSAASEGPIFDKISSTDFLNQVVYPALEGNLEGAASGARGLGLTVSSSDGLITVRVYRAINPSSPGGNKHYAITSFIQSVCGDTAYTNNVGVTTIFTNECGEMVGTEPNINNSTTPVLVRIPMSEFFTVLSSNMITGMVPQ